MDAHPTADAPRPGHPPCPADGGPIPPLRAALLAQARSHAAPALDGIHPLQEMTPT